jgi:NADPH:quinone reductase-like Zn-dependent oxidoreductase
MSKMRALVFEKNGLDNLKMREISSPSLKPDEVLIDVVMAGVNPVDYSVVESIPNVKPKPHIPGAEFTGEISEVGEKVSDYRKGDRVAVYNRVFDGTCNECVSKHEMLCENGGIMSIVTNGGFAEEISIPARNLVKLPDETSWELAASIPVAALTSFHALKRADLGFNENFVVFGASGNTGMFATQFGRMFGSKVYALSKKDWVKDFGADKVLDYDNVREGLSEATQGRMADVVLNSVGASTWDISLSLLSRNGRLVFFGALTGAQASIPLREVYSKQVKIIGSTGGTREEMRKIVNISSDLKVKVWRKFKLEEGVEALRALFSDERQGRVMIEI